MMTHASGTFDVKLASQETHDPSAALGRMSIDKQFHGELEATSKGEMLASRESNGSAVYVALERVTGTLQGLTGVFVLIHNGTANSEGQQLTINVAPGSGAGELAGLSGSMKINILEKMHYYTFDYSISEGG